jgi:recombination protein RecR
MLRMRYPSHLVKVIEVLKRLPGVGSRSAERFAFQFLTWKAEHLAEMAHILKDIPQKLRHCLECGCLIDEGTCPFCDDSRRQAGTLCIIAFSRDVFAIEETREYRGFYHVLGGLLSPLEGIGPEKLQLAKLKHRLLSLHLQEVVIALDSTLEGDATAYYLKQELEPLGVHISRLAFGLPMGSSLDYVDGGTLARAFSARSKF